MVEAGLEVFGTRRSAMSQLNWPFIGISDITAWVRVVVRGRYV